MNKEIDFNMKSHENSHQVFAHNTLKLLCYKTDTHFINPDSLNTNPVDNLTCGFARLELKMLYNIITTQ